MKIIRFSSRGAALQAVDNALGKLGLGLRAGCLDWDVIPVVDEYGKDRGHVAIGSESVVALDLQGTEACVPGLADDTRQLPAWFEAPDDLAEFCHWLVERRDMDAMDLVHVLREPWSWDGEHSEFLAERDQWRWAIG